MSRLAVLAYHKVGEPPPEGWRTWHYVPAETFRRQLLELLSLGWQVVDVPTLVRGLDHPATLPARAALVTFDDGCRCVRQVALPILRELGLPAALFVPTDHVGGWNRFDRGAEPDEPICGWEDLRALQEAGVSIQSHGTSHRGFSLLSPAEREEELRASRQLLEERLGQPVQLFAYPYSDTGGDPGAVALAGYRAAFLCGGGAPVNEIPPERPFLLDRLPLYPDSHLPQLLAKNPAKTRDSIPIKRSSGGRRRAPR